MSQLMIQRGNTAASARAFNVARARTLSGMYPDRHLGSWLSQAVRAIAPAAAPILNAVIPGASIAIDAAFPGATQGILPGDQPFPAIKVGTSTSPSAVNSTNSGAAIQPVATPEKQWINGVPNWAVLVGGGLLGTVVLSSALRK